MNTQTATAPAPRLSPSDVDDATLEQLRAELRESHQDTDTARLAFQDVSAKLVEALRNLKSRDAEISCLNQWLSYVSAAATKAGWNPVDADSPDLGDFVRMQGERIAAMEAEIESLKYHASDDEGMYFFRIQERDAARADAAALRQFLEQKVMPRYVELLNGYFTLDGQSVIVEAAKALLAEANPGAPLLALQNAAVAYVAELQAVITGTDYTPGSDAAGKAYDALRVAVAATEAR